MKTQTQDDLRAEWAQKDERHLQFLAQALEGGINSL